MPVVVHLKDGTNKELRLAQTCAWELSSNGLGSPRWLVCRNYRGEVLGTFKESDVNGFRIVPAEKRRLRLPKILRRSAV
jgi:hypothetical protein